MTSPPITQILPPPQTSAAPVEPPRRSAWGRFIASPWASFLLRRAISLVAMFFALLLVAFLIVQLIPGDPAVAIAGSNATTVEIEALRTSLGLDLPLWQQFVNFVGGVFTGDLGTSFMYGQPVATIIQSRIPFTLALAAAAIVLSLVIAVPLGIVVGVATRAGKRSWLDATFGAVTGFIDSVPGYIMATVLVVLFGYGVGVLEIVPPAFSSRMPVASYVLPVIALSIGPVCTVARVVRREMNVVLEQDYMRTARGWRLPAARRYLGWALPNLLTSTLTLSGLVLTGMVGGAIIIETVFAIPGLGTGIIRAILDRDYPVIQGLVLVIGMMAALVNLLVDVILGIADPRTLGGQHD